MTRTMIVFPTYIGQMFGVNAIEIGARKVWVHTLNARVEVSRFAFTPEELDANNPQTALAIKASQLAYPR